MGSISAQKLCILLTLIYCKDFFVILQYEQVQEVHGNYINGFYKNPFQGDWARLGLKNGASSKFVLLLLLFSLYNERTLKYIEIIYSNIVFQKKVLSRVNGPFWVQLKPKRMHLHNMWTYFIDSLILQNESEKEIHELVVFQKKTTWNQFILQKWPNVTCEPL